MSIRNGNRCLSILIKNSNSRINPATTAAILQARFNSTTSSSSSSTASSSFTLPRFNLPTSSLRLKPTSASYFTGRPIYTDLLLELDRLTNKTKRSLEQNHFLPRNSNLNHLSSSTSTSTLTNKNVWKPSSEMSVLLGTNLKAAQYRSLIKKLSTLYRYRDLVINHLAPKQVGKDRQLAMEVMTLLDSYSRQDLLEGIESEESKELDQLDLQQPSSSSNSISTVESISNLVDEQGRSYALGRRKESSCRVWLIPTKPSSDPHQTQTTPSIGKVLINSQPMSSYFTRTNHRESILHPLKLVGLLGTFNIFTLVKGGGHSGQAGAIAHGLSKALVRWFQHQFLVEKDERKRELLENRWKEVRGILLKDGVLKRDPRMVERKKTGLAKARKAYTWVKR